MPSRPAPSTPALRRKRLTWPTAVAAAVMLPLLLGGCADDGTTALGGGPAGSSAATDSSVRMARATWRTGHMQGYVYQQLLEELGYDVADPAQSEGTPAIVYPQIASGEVDLWANGWFPLHDIFLDRTNFAGQEQELPLSPVGVQVSAGALQGYLVDAATAEQLGITSMSDLVDPDVAAAFDRDDDGRADLVGCDEGWGCNEVIGRHIAELDWGSNVTQQVGSYDELMDGVVARVEAGEPALYYTWTPNWTSGVLVPGEDVVWLPSPALPGDEDTSVDGLAGCAGDADPCDLGWPVNDIRAVANDGFLADNPRAAALLEAVEIPLDDIAAQNAEMHAADEYPDERVAEDAAEWITDNRDLVDEWLAHAEEAR